MCVIYIESDQYILVHSLVKPWGGGGGDGWPPSEPCLRACARGELRGIGELLPVGEYSTGEPASVLLVTGGCSEIPRDFKPRSQR